MSDPWSKPASSAPIPHVWPRKHWLHKQPGVCHYCGKTLKDHEKTVDHKHPQRKDGTDTPDNWVVSCASCNLDKGHMTYDQYMLSLKLRPPRLRR